jgi:hypothetical protein
LQLRPHLFAEGSKRIRLDAMLPGQRPNVEQSSFNRFQARRIEGQCLGGSSNAVVGLAGLNDRTIEGS